VDLRECAKIVGGDFEGESFEVTKMNTLRDATKSEISFVSNSKYIKDIQNSNAGAIIVDKSTKEFVPSGCIALVVESPYLAMAILSKHHTWQWRYSQNSLLPQLKMIL